MPHKLGISFRKCQSCFVPLGGFFSGFFFSFYKMRHSIRSILTWASPRAMCGPGARDSFGVETQPRAGEEVLDIHKNLQDDGSFFG